MPDFIKIFPYLVGAAFSPVLLVTVLYILSRPTNPIKKSLSYLVGATITISAITMIIFYSTKIKPEPSPNHDLIPHIIIGLLLLFLAFDIYKKGPAKNEHKANKKSGLFRYFGIGVLLMVTNFTTIAMIFEVALGMRQYGIVAADKNLYLAATVLFSLLPILLPLLVLAFAGNNSAKILDWLSSFMHKYAHIVTSVFFAVLGIFSLLKPFIG